MLCNPFRALGVRPKRAPGSKEPQFLLFWPCLATNRPGKFCKYPDPSPNQQIPNSGPRRANHKSIVHKSCTTKVLVVLHERRERARWEFLRWMSKSIKEIDLNEISREKQNREKEIGKIKELWKEANDMAVKHNWRLGKH